MMRIAGLLEMTAVLGTTAGTAAQGHDAYVIWGAILFAAAVVLLVVELFVPSGGLIGILAGIALIASVIAFFKYDTSWGVGSIVGYIILLPILTYLFFKYWLNSRLGSRMVLGGFDENADDPDAAAAASEHARRERLQELMKLVGAEGTAETALRPVGTVRIAGQRLDAMAEGGVIEMGAAIVVTDVYDNQVKVRTL